MLLTLIIVFNTSLLDIFILIDSWFIVLIVFRNLDFN